MSFRIWPNATIHPTAEIDVREGFIGDGAVIREHVKIEGQRVEIGRECFVDRGATIGGGSCFDPGAFLKAGDWLHVGRDSHLNTARGLTIGHECALRAQVFTHGAYSDPIRFGVMPVWAPTVIGNHCWLPEATVLAGVTIGEGTVVSAKSLVNRDLPPGVLAGGIPAKVLRPLQPLASETSIFALLEGVLAQTRRRDPSIPLLREGWRLWVSTETVFDIRERSITGTASAWSTLLKDQLRRNGIRFRYVADHFVWRPWKESPVER